MGKINSQQAECAIKTSTHLPERCVQFYDKKGKINMGLDIEIGVGLKKKPDDKVINRIQNLIKECNPIDGLIFVEEDEYRIDTSKFEVFLIISSCTRYYGECYERGPFLAIYGLLKYLKAAFLDYSPTIFYGNDNGIGEISDAELDELMGHFIKYGEEPYRNSNYDAPFDAS